MIDTNDVAFYPRQKKLGDSCIYTGEESFRIVKSKINRLLSNMRELKFLYSDLNQLWQGEYMNESVKIQLFVFVYYYLDDNDKVNHIVEVKTDPEVVPEECPDIFGILSELFT